jgi:dihydroorotase
VHIAHISTAAAVDAVRRGKRRGVRVTAEATPHHLLLTDQAVKDTEYDTATKMNPPLRAEADRVAVIEGLRDGTIDCIATDHAPHTVDDKKVEFDQAAFGIVGLETAVALCLDRLVRPGLVSLSRLVSLLSTHPARVLSLPGGSLAVGGPADVTVLDLDRERTVDPARFQTKGRNTPYAGWALRGWPVATIVGGTIAWQDLATPSRRGKAKSRTRGAGAPARRAPARDARAARRRKR